MIICSDKEVGLKAIIAIHDTTLGPALGGTRMWNYASDEEALRDVLRLSKGMTYKSALAGLNLGGGKAVIIGDPKTQKSEALFRTYGRFIEGLAGRYITAEDVSIKMEDLEYVRMETKYVTGVSEAKGGSGDPSPVTAMGTYVGIKAAVKHATGRESVSGKKVGIQGAGSVSRYLVEHLVKEGAEVYICDLYKEKAEEVAGQTGARIVDSEEIYDLDMDIFSPCALGGILNDETIPKLKCDIIAGAANNQLDNEEVHGQMLNERGILYAPDYVINAGGVINVANELEGYNREYAHEQASRIYDTILQILRYSDENNVPTYTASNRIAELRLSQVSRVKNIYASHSQYAGRLGELST